MKTGLTRLTVLALVLAGSLGPGTFNATAELEVSAAVQINAAADFYQPLAAGGAWVEVGRFGRCWHPAGVSVEWRPYCDGTWVWTDCGWYWQSDEPWAWACYHYGSWIDDPNCGWVWIPGVEWAPAWVDWRIGAGYIGWAPCSPRGVEMNSGAFVFVDERHFHERHRSSTVIVNNLTIVNHTRQITGSRRASRNIGGRRQTVVVNSGPDVNTIERVTGRKFTAMSVQEADRHTPIPPAVRHRQSESPGGAKMPAVQEQTRPVPEHPVRPASPDRNLPAPKPRIIPPPQPLPHETPAMPPSGPPPKLKNKITPSQPPPEVPPAGPEERNYQGPDHEKDKDRGR